MEPSQTVAARDARPATGVPDRKGRHVRYHPRSTQRSEVFWKMEGGVVVIVVVVDDDDFVRFFLSFRLCFNLKG